METMGPFLFNGVRFLIGVVALSPVVWYLSKKPQPDHKAEVSTKKLLIAGTMAGLLLFIAISFHQYNDHPLCQSIVHQDPIFHYHLHR